MFSSAAKNTTVQVAARIVHLISSVILARLIIGFLDKEGYGTYGFLTATILFFATIADWGTGQIGVREASQNKKREQAIFSTTFFLRLGLAILTFIVVNVLFRIYEPWQEFVPFATVGSLVLLFVSIKTSLTVIFQTKLQLEKAALVDILGSVLFVVFTFLLLREGGDMSGVMTAWVVATAGSLFLGLALLKGIMRIVWVWDKFILVKIIRESLPLGGLLLAFSIYNRVDIIILEHFHGVSAVAVYDLAYRVHGNLVLGAAFIMNSIFPVLAREYKKGKIIRLRGEYRRLLGLLFMGGACIAAGFWLFAGPTVWIFTGASFPEFADSVGVLRILVFATFISYLNHLTGYSLIAFGRQKIFLVIGLFALLFNVSLNLVFIPQFSYFAAAVITVMTELIVFAATSVLVVGKIFRV